MIFILYSEINAASISSNLGMPEYSYYFVLKGFQEALRALGDVVVVQNPALEVDPIFREKQRKGIRCVFLSFSPPNKTLTSLACPTICVFAWEFSNLPDEIWDDEPRNDWHAVLTQLSGAISLSTYTAQVVKAAMGKTYPVCAIPVPVYGVGGRYIGELLGRYPLLSMRRLLASCTVIDSNFYQVDANSFSANIPAAYFRPRDWSGERVELQFRLGDEGAALMGGFYEPEPWGGAWSRIAEPWVLLPFSLIGRCTIGVEIAAYGPNVGKEAAVSIGGKLFPLPLSNDFVRHEFTFDIGQPANLVQFSGLDISVLAGARDPRSMGIALRRLWVERQGEARSIPLPPHDPVPITFEGVVYTSVLNPGDDRKNWVEMFNAFCFAFRDEPRATLVLKMTHRSVAACLERFHHTLQRIGSIKCRVIILHGYLDDDAFQQLIDISTYCVNSSRCEGLCLPLMEFMSCGVPAIAPDHTAMRDYIKPDNAFIVENSLEPGIWPHDARDLLRTLRYRLNWRSLVTAFEESFRTALSNPEKYRQMSLSASQAQRDFCSQTMVEEKLQAFFEENNFNSDIENKNLLADGCRVQ